MTLARLLAVVVPSCTWVMASSPSTTLLSASTMAPEPMAIWWFPAAVPLAPKPTKTLLAPAAVVLPEPEPTATLFDPVAPDRAALPMATDWLPFRLPPAEYPITTL